MAISDMQITVSKAINLAVMSKINLIIVEGKEDLGIYSDLLLEKSNDFNVKPIEYFKNCSSGCKEIETQVSKLHSQYPSGHKVYKFFKGIVDRDAKPFRGELCEKEGIYYLDTYSFESAFITNNSILSTVKLLTTLANEQLNNKLTDKILRMINQQFSEFYYICLEALKNAVEEDYQGLIGFKQSYDSILLNQQKRLALEAKKDELDEFATRFNITSDCILNMKSYCKGKWHLRYFLNSVKKFISELYNYCGSELTQCPYCEIKKNESCLYKTSISMNVDQIVMAIKKDINNADLSNLKSELFKMAD